MMRVLVTGGTGFVGRQILRELRDAGHGTFLLARKPDSAAARAIAREFSATIRAGDILNPDSLANACHGIDAVINLVGIISEVGKQTFEHVHTRGTRHIVAAAQSGGVQRFIQMSALGTRANAVARYHQTKWAAEEIVRGSELDWTIFRPSIIYGAGDGFVNLFARLSRFSPVVPLIGGGRMKLQPIAVESVAEAFVKSLNEPRAVGQTFALCGQEVLTLAEIVDAILATTRRRRIKLTLPFGVARVQAALLEFVCGKLLGQAPPLNRDQLLMLQEDNVGDCSRTAEVFELRQIRFSEGIASYLNMRHQS
jgi:NADH dehydrogenase